MPQLMAINEVENGEHATVDGYKFPCYDLSFFYCKCYSGTLGAEDELKHAVAFVRPVSVAFEVVSGFRAYKSGIYTSTTCGSSPMDVNHAVLCLITIDRGLEHRN